VLVCLALSDIARSGQLGTPGWLCRPRVVQVSLMVCSVSAELAYRQPLAPYLLLSVACRAPTKAVLYVNDGSSPCDESSWRQLPQPATGPGASHTFESSPAFVYAHQFVGSDQVIQCHPGEGWSWSLECMAALRKHW
jgi:hypothetical protein